jgi:hypothetical protein
MDVSTKIAIIDDSVKLAIELKINAAKTEVINNIRVIIKSILENNQATLMGKNDSDTAIKQATILAEQFFTQYNASEKLTELKELSSRVKNVTSVIVNRVGGELMHATAPERSLLAMMSALTNQKNLIDFFLIQTMPVGKRVAEGLEAQYDDSVLNQLFP